MTRIIPVALPCEPASSGAALVLSRLRALEFDKSRDACVVGYANNVVVVRTAPWETARVRADLEETCVPQLCALGVALEVQTAGTTNDIDGDAELLALWDDSARVPVCIRALLAVRAHVRTSRKWRLSVHDMHITATRSTRDQAPGADADINADADAHAYEVVVECPRCMEWVLGGLEHELCEVVRDLATNNIRVCVRVHNMCA